MVCGRGGLGDGDFQFWKLSWEWEGWGSPPGDDGGDDVIEGDQVPFLLGTKKKINDNGYIY